MQNVNIVAITGNLTRDPELRATPGGMNICGLRVACNGRRKNNATGQWEDDPNYFDVTVFGTQGENCKKYLAKGRALAVSGRLDWREWEHEGAKRQAVQIIADTVQFLGDSSGGNGGGHSGPGDPAGALPPVPVSGALADDDIPF